VGKSSFAFVVSVEDWVNSPQNMETFCIVPNAASYVSRGADALFD
jgi:hypothetical protein